MTKYSRFTAFVLAVSCVCSLAQLVQGQQPTAQPTPADAQADEQKQKDQEAAEKKATELLEQIVTEAQGLKLPENRIRVQIAGADMLWKRNEARARSLFSLAGDGVAEMMRSTEGSAQRRAAQLRQEVVLTAAQHDAPLAYQLLAVTRSLTPTTEGADGFRGASPDSNLEQTLLARVAALDPRLAAQKVEEALAKGEYPYTLVQVVAGLESQDKDAASKLTAKVVSKLQSENLLANSQAQAAIMNLLYPGPRSTTGAAGAVPAVVSPAPSNRVAGINGRVAVLSESSFEALLNSAIDAGLRATPQPNNQRGGNQRGRGNFGGQQSGQNQLTDGQIEQQNARRFLFGLQALLPQIDQHLPARAAAVRTKLTELGMNNEQRNAMSQLGSLIQQGTPETLLAAAPTAPRPIAGKDISASRAKGAGCRQSRPGPANRH